MRTARELLIAYLRSARDSDGAADLFAPDAVVDVPFASSLGLPGMIRGREGIRTLLTQMTQLGPELRFSAPTVFIDTPEQVFAEYSATTRTVDGRPFNQHFATYLQVADDQIVAVREYF